MSKKKGKKPKFSGLGTLEDILRSKFATDKDAMYEPVVNECDNAQPFLQCFLP